MAFLIKGNRITMDAYDYGLQLPIDVEDGTFEPTDKMLFELKKSKDSVPLISKEYVNVLSDTNLFRFFLEFTEKESLELPPGNYVYYVKYIKNGELRDTLVSGEDFKIKK